MRDIDRGQDIARIGVLGAATFAALAGGATVISSAAEFHRLQNKQRTTVAAIGSDNTQVRELVPGMTQSLETAVAGGIIFVVGSAGAIAAGSSLIISSRKRP